MPNPLLLFTLPLVTRIFRRAPIIADRDTQRSKQYLSTNTYFSSYTKNISRKRSNAWKEDPNFHQEGARGTKGYADIPEALFEAITFPAQALPKRSAPEETKSLSEILGRITSGS